MEDKTFICCKCSKKTNEANRTPAKIKAPDLTNFVIHGDICITCWNRLFTHVPLTCKIDGVYIDE
jgi:hypothetical protein